MKRFLTILLFVCALALLFYVGTASGQTAALMPVPRLQFANYPGGSLTFYQAGTSTLSAPFTDATGTTPLSNPVVLDAAGNAPAIYLGAGSYKVTLADANSVLIWTQDNVRDIALLGQVTVNVKNYGAKGDAVTDDSVAIAAACTAVGTGTLVFPPATYKIVSGNITTCLPGVTVNGYGATLDITAASAPVFAFNVGGSIASTATVTLVAGFRVNGAQANAATYLARFDNVFGVTLRDINVSNANLAVFNGQDSFSDIENTVIATAAATGAAITYSTGTYPTGQQPFQSHIDKLSCTGALTCIEADAGEIDISNSVIDSCTTGIHINTATGARVAFRDGMINLRNGTATMRGFLIDSVLVSGRQPDISNSTFQIIDQTGTYPMIAIDNNQVNSVTLASTFVINAGSSSVSSIIRSAASLTLTMTKTLVNQYTANASGGLFNLPAGGSISGTISGSNFSGLSSSNQLYWLVTGSTGQFTNITITGNTINAINGLGQLNSGTLVNSNWISAGSGASSNVSFAMTATNTMLVGNFFFPGATKTGSVPQACANNLNYACN